MEIFWYLVLGAMLALYVIFDGYDFGAGIIHLFIAKDENEKKAIHNAIGPFWDANEVWLIAAGGVLFFAFPQLYASAFSGFYLPLMLLLWMLIFRAIGIELRNQIHHPIWETIWDKAFGISSLLIALFLGSALGNVVRGVNLGMVTNGKPTVEENYFFLPLWNADLNPLADHHGIIDWFTIIIGFVAVVTLTIHGAAWIILKTNSTLNARLRPLIFKLTIILILLVAVSGTIWWMIKPLSLSNFTDYPWMWIFPAMALAGLIGLLFIRKYKKDYSGFLCSTLFIAGSFSSTAASLFPNLLPSTNSVIPSITIYNAAAHEYGLSVGLSWFIFAIILVIAYFIIQHRVFKGKLDEKEYGGH